MVQSLAFQRVRVKAGDFFDENAYTSLIDALMKYHEGFGSKRENYTEKRLDIENHLCFDYLYDTQNGQVVSGSGIYNGLRYPARVYRVLNRTFILPAYRRRLFQAYNTRFLLPHQIEENRSKLGLIFVSREGARGGKMLDWWKRRYSAHLPTAEWNLSSGFVQVAPGPATKRSFQKIISCGMSHYEWKPDELDFQNWSQLPY